MSSGSLVRAILLHESEMNLWTPDMFKDFVGELVAVAKKERMLIDTIAALYQSEINASVSWFWDGGIDVAIGDAINGWHSKACFDIGEIGEVAAWLDSEAKRIYPDSRYAKGATR